MARAVTVNKVLNIELVEKMLNHFQTYNFIKTVNNRTFQFGFMAENLKEFIRREWLLTNVISSDRPTFLFNSFTSEKNFKTAFGDVKNFLSSGPFSLVEIDTSSNEKDEALPESVNAVDLVRNQFKKQVGTILRNQFFCSPAEALEEFYKKQREHKLWWRKTIETFNSSLDYNSSIIFSSGVLKLIYLVCKFSALPGRFINSKVSTNEYDKSMISEIQAEFPWGLELVETIKHQPNLYVDDKDFFEIKFSKRKKSMPQVIICETVLENIAFAYLCDSYERLNGEKERDVLRFNKKLAPFKVSIAGTGISSDTVKNLEELSLLLAKQVRKLGLSVLLLPDMCITTIERQILRNDALGVPYTLILNDKTLQDGTIAVRSRDTTLKEYSHVSLIVDYLNEILK